MLSDHCDDDYFTPLEGTSLCNIFKKTHSKSENSTLKYQAQRCDSSNQGDSKSIDCNPARTSKCLWASAVFAYELVESTYSYTSKGKLGFAIMEVTNPTSYKIVLYNAEKKTISTANMHSNFEVTVLEKYISFYDDKQINWSVLLSEPEACDNFIKLLDSLNISVVFDEDVQNTSTLSECYSNNPSTLLDCKSAGDVKIEHTKASLLSRVASVGQSMLLMNETIDQATLNEITNQRQLLYIRNKKRETTNDIPTNAQSSLDAVKRIKIDLKPDDYYEPNISNIPDSNFQINETCRVQNSDNSIDQHLCPLNVPCINTVKVLDKIEEVITIIKKNSTPAQVDHSFDTKTEILLKLIKEYEYKIMEQSKKIKYLESIQNKKESNESLTCEKCDKLLLKYNSVIQENIGLKEQIKELESDFQSLNCIQNEFRLLSELCSKNESDQDVKKSELDNIAETLTQLKLANEEIASIKEKYNLQCLELEKVNEDCKNAENSIKRKIKNIMNEAYHILCYHLEGNEYYQGSAVKSAVANVLKKVTLQFLNHQK